MFGKFRCMQCGYRFPYRQIVNRHFICLDCYAWARDIPRRNDNKPLCEREVNILLATYYDGYAPWGFWKMLDSREADYILGQEIETRIPMRTCIICHKYYRPCDAGGNAICKKCSHKMKKLVVHQALPKNG